MLGEKNYMSKLVRTNCTNCTLALLGATTWYKPRHVNLGATILTLTSPCKELQHGSNLETCKPRSYYTDLNLAWLGATTWYKTK